MIYFGVMGIFVLLSGALIEQWRAEQIASGEAKANANFQPLGGDWRERVKRKRAQLTLPGWQVY